MCTALLCYCSTALLLYCATALLRYCSTALLLYCATALLQYYSATLLLYCSTALLLYCQLHILLAVSFCPPYHWPEAVLFLLLFCATALLPTSQNLLLHYFQLCDFCLNILVALFCFFLHFLLGYFAIMFDLLMFSNISNNFDINLIYIAELKEYFLLFTKIKQICNQCKLGIFLIKSIISVGEFMEKQF